MAISEAETSAAPVLLKESDIPEASFAERKPADLGKAIFFWFGSDLSVIVKEQLVRRRYVW